MQYIFSMVFLIGCTFLIKKCHGYAIITNMSEMHLYENIHELHFFYDATGLTHNLMRIKENKIKIDELCNQSNFIMNCQFFIEYIDDEINHIENDLIKLQYRRNRRKRTLDRSFLKSVEWYTY